MIQRILELIKSKGLTPSQFADEIGVQRSGISHLMSGRNKPSLDFIIKLLERFPETSTDWLILGRGVMSTDGGSKEIPSVPDGIQFPESDRKPESFVADLKDTFTVPQRKKKNIDPKPAERIVVIYPDNTFRELVPE